jgi:hypothetical protein
VCKRLDGTNGTLYLFYGKEAKIISWEQEFSYTTEQYQQLREYSLLAMWYNIIVLNVLAPSEEKSADSKDSMRNQNRFVYHFPKYRLKCSIIF